MKLDPFLQINFDGAAVPAGKEMVHVQDFNWRFASEEKNLWNQPLSLHLRGPQRWHIQGANGSGKSTLLKLIASFPVEGQQTQGLFKVGAKIIGYLDQKFALFDGEKTLFDYFREQSRFDEAELRNQLALYGFSHDRVLVQIKNLSGGEMLRMSLARLFLAPELPDLIVLDEPTNNLDFQSIELLEKALDNYCGALIVVSHDRELTRKLNITHVLSLSDKIFSV